MSASTYEFKTEVRELLDLVIHSLYSHKEIFLRELISNASDAIDKLRFLAQSDTGLLEEEKEFEIQIIADREAGTLTVRDNGIGMDRDDAVRELGTIARSGTREFLAALREKSATDNPELIGQFGVGFYSAFMVADRVTVVSRKAGTPNPGIRWESAADGSFAIEDENKLTKGTDVILHLKTDDRKYLDEHEIRQIVRRYSDYIEHPVVMDVERTEGDSKVAKRETLNSRKALWLRNRAEIGKEEYAEFYRHVSHDFADPARVIHFRAEGTNEFTALLFIPAHEPLGIHMRDYKAGPMLYVRRVRIMENCEELIPPYLRFVRGVVDSSDLPLNVSREMLQNNRQIAVMRKSITKKVLDTLAEMKTSEYDEYVKVYRALGRVLKEGIHYDFERREALADLALFESTATAEGEYTTLASYLDRMKPDQKDIYYITAPSRAEALASPYLEALRKKGFEALLMLDEIDDIIMGTLQEYKSKALKNVVRGDIELDPEAKEEKKRETEKYAALIDLMKGALGDRVSGVRLSGRLTESACCLAAGEGDIDPRMEQILKSMGQDVPGRSRVLELNPAHPLVESMQALFERDAQSPLLGEYAELLYDQALLLEGSRIADPAAFARKVSRVMAEAARAALAEKP